MSPQTTEGPPQTIEKPPKISDEYKKLLSELQNITEDPLKTTEEYLKNRGTFSKLGCLRKSINRAIDPFFHNNLCGQEGSKPEVNIDEDSSEDSLFFCPGVRSKREKLSDQIKTCFNEYKDKFGISDEYLCTIRDGEILPAEEFQSLDPKSRDLVFLWSSFCKRNDFLEPLYEMHANIHSTVPRIGYTALHLAAFSGCVKSCEWLISKGPDLISIVNGLSPLHCAVISNSFDCAKLLLNHGAKLDSTIIDCAFENHATDCLQYLLNEYVKNNTADEKSQTALKTPADWCMQKCVQIMMSCFPDAKLTEKTPLHLAAGNNLFKCCQFLLERGADPNAVDYKGRTALHFAAKARSSECLKILLKAGCNVNAQDFDGRTPLHMAVSGWNPYSPALNALKVLVKGKAIVNVSDKLGYSPLHLAARNFKGIQDPSLCVDFLITSGASVISRDRKGVPALSVIRRNTPGCINAICRKLDSSIAVSHSGSNDKQDVQLQFDFSYLLDHSSTEHMSFLEILKKEGPSRLIAHPLCQAFVHLHWQVIRRYYFCRLLLWYALAVLLTAYVKYNLDYECHNAALFCEACGICLNKPAGVCLPSTTKNISTTALKTCLANATTVHYAVKIYAAKTNHSCPNSFVIGSFFVQQARYVQPLWCMLVLMAILESTPKILLTWCLLAKKAKFESTHIFSIVHEWFVICVVFWLSGSWSGQTIEWQKTVGGVAVVLAWFNLTHVIYQLPIFETHKFILLRVLIDFFKLLLINSSLLIGLASFFCVLFPSDKTFKNPLVGFIKILAIVTGQLDFDVFEKYLGSEIYSALFMPNAIVIIFLFSVVFMTLIGIAVYDYQRLRRIACVNKLSKQIELVNLFETVIRRSYLPERIVQLLFGRLWRQVEVGPFSCRLSTHEKRLPKKTLMSAINLVEQKGQWVDSDGCWLDQQWSLPDSISKWDDENSYEKLWQLKNVNQKLRKLISGDTLSEDRFNKHEKTVSEKLQQVKDVNRDQNKLISKLVYKSCKLEKNVYEELRQLKEMVRALNGSGLQKTNHYGGYFKK